MSNRVTASPKRLIQGYGIEAITEPRDGVMWKDDTEREKAVRLHTSSDEDADTKVKRSSAGLPWPSRECQRGTKTWKLAHRGDAGLLRARCRLNNGLTRG